MTATAAYPMEIHLMGGETVVCGFPAEGAKDVQRFNPGIVMPAEETDEARGIARMLYTLLMYRMNEGEGFNQLTDLEGRQWVFRADSILAFNIQAPRGSRLGFEPLATLPDK